MGGFGSGSWIRHGVKSRVESSLTMAVRDVRKSLRDGAAGSLAWTSNRGSNYSIGYTVAANSHSFTLTLSYRWNDSEDIRIPIMLQPTWPQFGGQRWWFTCPLIVGGISCRCRVGKLYLPPRSKYFGCRKCHNLTYRSSQEAHSVSRGLSRLGLPCDAETCRMFSQRMRG